MSKEKVQVAAQIYPVNGVINVDYRYGPYDSIAEAVQTLGEDNLDCIKAGLKFGVKESDGTVTDYVFLEDNGGADKVQKVLHIDEATTEKAGLMSAQDKSALAAVQAKADQNAQDIEGLGDDISDANASIQQNASAIQQNTSDIGSINASITQILAAQTELRTAVNGLTGIDNTNYKGIFPNTSSLPDMDRSGWALVGSSLSSLLLYTYTDVNTVWTLYSNDTYDFTDYSGLVSQVATIGLNLDEVTKTANGNEFANFNEGQLSAKYVDNSYVLSTDGTFTAYNGWARTDYINVSIFSAIVINAVKASSYNAMYDKDKNFVRSFSLAIGDNQLQIPDNVHYIVISNNTSQAKQTKFFTSEYRFLNASEKKFITGVQSEKTTYDSSNYGYPNRVSVFYPLDNKTKEYVIKLSDIVYAGTTLNIRLTSTVSPFGGGLVRAIANVSSVTETSISVTRTDAELASAKYLAVIANANGAGVSFGAALYINEGYNLVNVEKSILEYVDTTFLNVYGKADFTYSYPATSSTYVTNKNSYTFKQGHTYKVRIEYPEGYDGQTYMSIRNGSEILQNGLLRGNETREGSFLCEQDGGTELCVTLIQSHDDALTFGCSVIDMTEVTLYSNRELIKELSEAEPSGIIGLNGKVYLDGITEQLARRAKSEVGGQSSTGEEQLVLLWCSDIHGDAENMARILELHDAYSSKINDVICTGDMIADKWTDDMDWWNTVDAGKVLVCLGNHDILNTGGDAITATQAYNRYIKPYVSQWGVVQPTEAEANGYTYFYKDYTGAKIRLVFLDNMYWNTAQATWLQDVLADAITNGYAVICARHYPFEEEVALDTPFNSIAQYELHWYTPEVLNIIDTFISNGGEFVCWLTGHTHNDFIGTLADHPNQLVITIANASCNSYWDDTERTRGKKSQDCVNLIGFDYNQKMIKMARVGADYDRLLRHKGTLCYKYDTHTLIFTS